MKMWRSSLYIRGLLCSENLFFFFLRDILLLEAGFLSVLVAPLRYRYQSKRRAATVVPHDGISFWLVRWLLFRLMFQSGVVKLTSGCPTWWGLTGWGFYWTLNETSNPLSPAHCQIRGGGLSQTLCSLVSPATFLGVTDLWVLETGGES